MKMIKKTYSRRCDRAPRSRPVLNFAEVFHPTSIQIELNQNPEKDRHLQDTLTFAKCLVWFLQTGIFQKHVFTRKIHNKLFLEASQFPAQRSRLNNFKTFPRNICFFHMNFQVIPQLLFFNLLLLSCLFSSLFFKEAGKITVSSTTKECKDYLTAQRMTF